MIDLEKDKKSGTLIITKIDKEGFHRQLNVTKDEIIELFKLFWKTYLFYDE